MENDIGKIISFHRKKTGLSQKEIADIAGIGKTVVFDIEKGKLTVGYDKILKLFKILNINIIFSSQLMDQYQKEKYN